MKEKLPQRLRLWLDEKQTSEPADINEALVPGNRKVRKFILVTALLKNLDFKKNDYNPREPNQSKVNELAASIETLSLLSPLTCACISEQAEATEQARQRERDARNHDIPKNDEHGMDKTKNEKKALDEEKVVLIDGRHRYEALKLLAVDDPSWGDKVRIDLKIYFDIDLSDVYLLATYLNRTRKALAKGEYYKFIVEIWETKTLEWVREHHKSPTEVDVFQAIEGRDLTDKYTDLSVGRIIGMVGFDEEDKVWWPMVGLRQQEKLPEEFGDGAGYRPLTAGNMATLLSYLCYKKPYSDDGSLRATEITNVVKLGRYFRERVLKPVPDYDTATPTSVGCKHWCLHGLGTIIRDSADELRSVGEEEMESLFATPKLRWERIEDMLRAYVDIMKPQAELINKYRDTKGSNPEKALEILKGTWAYQTQTDQVLGGLYPLLHERLRWTKYAGSHK